MRLRTYGRASFIGQSLSISIICVCGLYEVITFTHCTPGKQQASHKNTIHVVQKEEIHWLHFIIDCN
jgi:hypothetical protein